MKTNKILLIITIFILAMSSTQAEYRIYNNVEDFEADKWAICEAATDGCNNYIMVDWKVWWGTKKYCWPDFTPEWNCTKYKEDSITTMSITTTAVPETTSSDIVACTMEYAPVCWVDWKTYWNKCMAVSWAKVEIDYNWECITKKELSENDKNFYNTIKNRLDSKYQERVIKVVEKYQEKIENLTKTQQERINKKMINLLEQNISKLLLQYPQDTALPEKVNNVYLILTMFKFELMKLSF